MNELLLLAAGGLVVLLVNSDQRYWSGGTAGILALRLQHSAVGTVPLAAAPFEPCHTFLKIPGDRRGPIWQWLRFASLRQGGLVERLDWLAEQ